MIGWHHNSFGGSNYIFADCTFYVQSFHTIDLKIFKNVSSPSSHKNKLGLSVFTTFRLSLRKFKKILTNTFIYELILIQIYIDIMKTQILHLIKYDLIGH